MQLIENFADGNKSEAARQLNTTRQQVQQWCNSTKPVYVYKVEGELGVYRKLN